MDANKEKQNSGILLVGHGTRNTSGIAEFFQLGEMIEALLHGFELQTAFLELVSPDMATGIELLVEKGVQEIIVVPVLLFAAGHAESDIPQAIEKAKTRLPHVKFFCTTPLDSHEKLLELSAQRLFHALHSAGLKAGEVTLLLVGRGSVDDTATTAMHRYASRLASRACVGDYRVAFMAMAEPLLATVCGGLEAAGDGPVVVQPHLLFQGDLLDQLRAQVTRLVERPACRQFVLAQHLGAARLLAEAFADLTHRVRPGRSLDKDVALG